VTILCVTNRMTDARSCVLRGQHKVTCDGYVHVWNPKLGRTERTERHCTGCLPKLATTGYLCWSCWEGVQHAFEEWGPFERMLNGIDRAVQRDNGGISAGTLGYVPIPGTQLALDELRSYLRYFHGNATLWVSTEEGAKDAVRFSRSVASAVRTHAVEEKAHQIKRTRCPKCAQLTLVWHPTPAFGGNVTVTCANEKCSHVLDQAAFEKVTAIEKTCCSRCRGERGCTNTQCSCHRSSLVADGDWTPGERVEEPFDPENPDHLALLPLEPQEDDDDSEEVDDGGSEG
jgi:hypothetical protein